MSFAVALAMGGCARVEVTQPPIPFETLQPAKVNSQTSFTARVFTKVGQEKPVEVAGAECVFESSAFRSKFVTPAEVLAPNMGEATPTASVTCTHDGLSKTKILKPFNKTIANINRNAQGVGLIGGAVGIVMSVLISNAHRASRVPADDIYAYKNANVIFEKDAP